MTNRTAIVLLVFVALLTWGGFIFYTRYVPPHTLIAFIAFFLLLGIALTSTTAPLAYAIGLRFLSSRLYRMTIRHALRQGVLLALCVIVNLILLALHSWNILTVLVVLSAAIIIEILSLARK